MARHRRHDGGGRRRHRERAAEAGRERGEQLAERRHARHRQQLLQRHLLAEHGERRRQHRERRAAATTAAAAAAAAAVHQAERERRRWRHERRNGWPHRAHVAELRPQVGEEGSRWLGRLGGVGRGRVLARAAAPAEGTVGEERPREGRSLEWREGVGTGGRTAGAIGVICWQQRETVSTNDTFTHGTNI